MIVIRTTSVLVSCYCDEPRVLDNNHAEGRLELSKVLSVVGITLHKDRHRVTTL